MSAARRRPMLRWFVIALVAVSVGQAVAADKEPAAPGAAASQASKAPPATAPATSSGATAISQRRKLHDDTTPCIHCHTTSGWLPARFPHDQTGFPLRGRHAETNCASCHGIDIGKARSADCVGCHVDRHRGSLGSMCQGCHTEVSWEPRFGVMAHRQTLNPLTGRHAALPCEECHVDKRDSQFTRNTRVCVDCHRRDFDLTPAISVDHRASRFSPDCQTCHTPLSFKQAAYAEHERCFPIAPGTIHSVVTCRQCHAPLEGLVERNCASNTARCTQCHIHEPNRTEQEHEGVPGYRYTDGACVGCHQTTAR